MCAFYCLLFLISIGISYCQDSSTEEYVICDDNNTCTTYDELNTTETVTLSTVESVNNTNNETINKNDTLHSDKNELSWEYDSNNCPCDLQRKYCDINCCCDIDCNLEQKLIFSSCEIVSYRDYDPKFCYASSYVYVNHTPAILEISHSDFFCIVSSNLPPSYLVQTSEIVKSIAEAEKLTKNFNKWPNVEHVQTNTFNKSETLRDGITIWIRKNNNTKIEQFHLPQRFITNVCLTKEPVKFLKSFKSSCSHMINEDISEDLHPSTYFNFKFMAFNSSLNYTLIQNITKECPRNICLTININLCDENFNNCEQVMKNDTRLQHDCRFSLYSSEQICHQLVKKVKYNFFHNGTFGFTNINLYLHLINVTFYISNENDELEQQFEVNYYWHNYRQNFSSMLSGNPGYIIGKPVLAANVNRTTFNNTVANNKFEFIRNGYNTVDNFLLLPDNVNGFCKLNNETYKYIDFGYNIRLSCREKYLLKNISKDATNICIDLQKQIFSLWKISLTNNSYRYIATFGNSNRYKVSEWVEILYKFDLNSTLESITGISDDTMILCHNLVNTLKINILYSKVDFKKAKNQIKILNVFMEFNKVNQIGLYINDKNTNPQELSVDFKLYAEVMFYDITGPKLEKFVNPPSFEIKVPRDFFYPFMSGAHSNNSNYFMVVWILFIINI